MGSSEILKRFAIVLSVHDAAATASLTRSQRLMRAFGHTTTTATGALSKFNRRFLQVGRALISFLIIRTVTVQLANFVKTLFTANEAVEKITASMKVLGGSLAYAQDAMDFVREIATRAPFHMEAIASAGQKLMAYGQNIKKWIPALLDWAAAFNATSGELDMWAAAMGKVLAMSPYIKRILINRGVDYKQWNEALSQTNQELSKEARYSEALMIVLGRFKGQAAELAKTMSGLRTNIHDVWMELSREVGLGAFATVRLALFKFYGGLKTMVTEQKETLWDIGEIFGTWIARLILITRHFASWRRGTFTIGRILTYIGRFILGRMIIGAIMGIITAVKTLYIMLGGPLMVAVVGISLVVSRIASAFVSAKIRALDLEVALGQVADGVEVIAGFWERTEQVLLRVERQTMRQLLLRFNEMYVGISRTRREMKALAEEDMGTLLKGLSHWDAVFQKTNIDIFLHSLRRAKATMEEFATAMPGTFERLTIQFRALQDAADRWGPLMPVEWNKQLNRTIKLGEELMAPGALFDAEKINTFQTGLEGLTDTLFKQTGAIMQQDQVSKLAAERREKEWLDVTKYMEELAIEMTRYRLNAEGVAGHEKFTVEYMRQRVEYGKAILESMEQQTAWVQTRNEIEGDATKTEAERQKLLKEAFKDRKGRLEYAVRISQAQAQLTGDTRGYVAVLQEVIRQVQLWLQASEDMPIDELKELIAMLLELQNAVKGVTEAEDELSFATEAAFSLWQQALNPIVSAFGSIVDGTKEMAKAFASALKSMIRWAIELLVKLALMAILMKILNITSGGMTGFSGAFSALMGGGLNPAAAATGSMRAFSTRGPQLAFAGGGEFGDITPRMATGPRGGGDTHIHMENAVVMDGEHFMRMVDSAQYKLERRKGGGV